MLSTLLASSRTGRKQRLQEMSALQILFPRIVVPSELSFPQLPLALPLHLSLPSSLLLLPLPLRRLTVSILHARPSTTLRKGEALTEALRPRASVFVAQHGCHTTKQSTTL